MMVRAFVIVGVGLALVGCGGARLDELSAYVDKVKAQPPEPLTPLPEIKQVDTFVYKPGSRRDPFVMDIQSAQAVIAGPASGLAPDPLRRKEELEQYPLDSLDMVGTMERDQTRWGIIRTPDGILHRVRVGNYMGSNNGQVTSINPERIQLIEIVPDGGGRWREEQAEIALKQ
jgi:type IV pilus assembly protein PilP